MIEDDHHRGSLSWWAAKGPASSAPLSSRSVTSRSTDRTETGIQLWLKTILLNCHVIFYLGRCCQQPHLSDLARGSTFRRKLKVSSQCLAISSKTPTGSRRGPAARSGAKRDKWAAEWQNCWSSDQAGPTSRFRPASSTHGVANGSDAPTS